ncbi:MAG: hypothetical protein AMS26_05170 [Bacteroides sp. SM23_62]|nr:MAG: hypothetical protein AMS26_05170 [Bacteroides sp. SM23_62]
MKILLVSPVRDQHQFTNKGILIPQLALFILQGLTPKKHEVKIVEEEYMQLDLDEECDVVGISCMTSNAYRGYRIADAFREKGKKVVMGGVHPSLLPDEALAHADAVVIGEAEGVWEKILEDIESDNLQQRYHEPNPDLDRYIPKDFSTLSKKRMYNLVPLQTSRGCPYDCDFCCVSNIFGKKIKLIPVKHVVKDIQTSGARNFIFLDDNIIGHKKYARELFTALIPLKIRWIGQSSISFARDLELMKLAKKSGCKGLFIGLESVLDTNIHQYNKLKSLEDTQQSIRKILKMGIMIQASVIFGFDDDTHETFGQTIKFLRKNRISVASINALTPYPGTRVFDKLKEAGRLLHEKWEYYDHHTVVFQPKNMTPLELQIGKIKAKTDFSKIFSIAERILGNLRMPVYYIAANLGYRRLAIAENRRMREFASHQLPDGSDGMDWRHI